MNKDTIAAAQSHPPFDAGLKGCVDLSYVSNLTQRLYGSQLLN